ncbi:MAG: ROK family protein [Planctomycetes bacterium]|nr:ROK family protein [Planctomycetota bacterium]
MREVCLGLDIGGTNCRLGIVDRAGEILREDSLQTGSFATFPDLVTGLAAGCRRLLEAEALDALAIGIGAPNGNAHRGTIAHAPNLPWKGELPLARDLGAALGAPAWLTNDANAAALGEMLYGGGRGRRDLLVVTLGTGLGSGFIVDGRLVYGHSSFAGELGHVIVEPGGRACGCGRQGCLERYVSVTALVAIARERLATDAAASSLRGLPDEKLTGAAIHDAARSGDEFALALFDEMGARLGLALANAAAITSPEKIFLYGGLAGAGEILLGPTRASFERNLLANFAGITIEVSELQGRNGALLGAAALAFHGLDSNDA